MIHIYIRDSNYTTERKFIEYQQSGSQIFNDSIGHRAHQDYCINFLPALGISVGSAVV